MPASVASIYEFVEVWNAAVSIVDVAKNYDIQPLSALARAKRLRAQGLPLRPLPDEAQAGRLSRGAPTLPPASTDAAADETAPAPETKPGRKLRATRATAFNCRVQTMVTLDMFTRLLAGGASLTPDRVREVLALGLAVEAGAGDEAEAEAEAGAPPISEAAPNAQKGPQEPPTPPPPPLEEPATPEPPRPVFDLFAPLPPGGVA